MKENLFITTTLPYCNGKMHVGAAFEFILADTINNYYKSLGFNTFLNIGLDQNGQKILLKSKELNLPVQQYVQDITKIWLESCKKLCINFDNFYQTSSEEHSEKVQNIWNILLNNGDIYEKEYKAKYCVGCESFKLDKNLIDNKCQDHPNTIINEVSEKNYFLNLEKYKNNILEWLNTNPLIPNSHYKELIDFINDYNEISISRLKSENIFGIDVPNDDTQIIFIWFEALCNYFIAADKWKGWNNCDTIQLYGVDNNRFQAHIYQSILSAIGYKNSYKMLIHGTILDKNGKKMSKTEGNVIDPIEQIEKWGLDAVRYYALVGLNTYDNSSWDQDKLVEQFNSEICNDWGNLVSRVLHLIDTKLNGETDYPTEDFRSHVHEVFNNAIYVSMDNYKIKDCFEKLNGLVKWANKYINDEKPWSLENPKEVLSNLYYLIVKVAGVYEWILPHRTDISEAIKHKKKVILFEKLKKAD